jgi:RNA polymerase sigma-70 factor (ECF subfamily)
MVLSNLDRELLARVLAGTEGAWEDFVDRFLPLIVHVVEHTGKIRLGKLPSQWRDDLVVEVLLALTDKKNRLLHQFQGQSSLGSYLVVIARRVAAKKLRKMRNVTPLPNMVARPTTGT